MLEEAEKCRSRPGGIGALLRQEGLYFSHLTRWRRQQAAMGYWGWQRGDGVFAFVFALGLPLIAAVVWGTFAVPNDPSRSGQAPIPTPGWLRLLLELTIFGFGAWALYDVGLIQPAIIFGLLTLSHYAFSLDRLAWLLQQ